MKFKLSDICIGGGSYGIAASAVEHSPDLPTYLRITDINDDGTLNFSGLKSVDDPNSSKYFLAPNDIVFARTGASTGRNYFYDGNDGEFVYAGFLIKFSIDPDKVNPMFLKYYCQSKDYYDWIASFNTGSTRGNINAQTLGNMPIPNVTREQQDFLVDILSTLDARISVNRAINHHLEQIAQAIFKSWFMEFEPTKPFTSIVQVLGGGTPQTNTAEYWNGTIPFFTPKDTNATYVLTTEKSLTESGLNNCNSRLYPVNTVFVTARGTVGKLAMAGAPMAMNQSCYALVGNAGYGQHFVYHLALETVESLKHKASGAVFDAIVTRDFESEIVPAPSVESVWVFEEKVAPIYKAILNNLKESARLAAIRDALLPRLVSGELSVADIDAK